MALSCENNQAVQYAINTSVSGNSRPLTLNYTINESSFSAQVDTGETALAQTAVSGDQVSFNLADEVGHTCTVTPSEATMAEEPLSVAIDCSTTGSVSVLVTDYQTTTAIANASVGAYIFNGEEGASPDDSTAYELLDQVTTNDEGRVTIQGLGFQERLVLRTSAADYAIRSDIGRTSSENPDTSISVALLAVDAAVAFDGSTESTVTVDGTPLAVTVPASAFVGGDGQVVSGEITAQLTNMDGSSNSDIVPGDYEAINSDTGEVQHFESLGAIDASFHDSQSNPLQLADGISASIRIPLAERASNPPQTVPLMHFNEVTGIWEQEGEATLKTDNDTNALYYEGNVGHFSIWNIALPYSHVYINGCVYEEGSDTPRTNVRVRAEGMDYIGRSVTYTDAEGNYSVPVRPNSDVLVSVDDASGISSTFVVSVGSQDVDRAECIEAIDGAMRVTLTWGANPRDLDTHFMGPTAPNGEVASERFRIAYYNKQVVVNGVTIDLDVDDVTSYGPEVTTVPEFPYPGVYRYAVHHYSGSGTTFQSPARVVLQLNGENYVYAPSEDRDTRTGEFATWVAFDVTVDQEGNATVQRVDQYMRNSEADISVNGMPPAMLQTLPAKEPDDRTH